MAHHFKFGGREYPLVLSYTFEEARTIKRLTGMTLAQVERSFAEDGTDPDCIFAQFVVSVQRAEPHRTEAEIAKVRMDEVELYIDPELVKQAADEPPTGAGGDAG